MSSRLCDGVFMHCRLELIIGNSKTQKLHVELEAAGPLVSQCLGVAIVLLL